jgi:hypothetical protein
VAAARGTQDQHQMRFAAAPDHRHKYGRRLAPTWRLLEGFHERAEYNTVKALCYDFAPHP